MILDFASVRRRVVDAAGTQQSCRPWGIRVYIPGPPFTGTH